MIRVVNGHDKSVRTIEEEIALLKKRLESLDEKERRVMNVVLGDVLSGNNGFALRELLQSLEYETKPVDLHTFLFDDYFMGVNGRNLFPKLVDDLYELFDGKYFLVILSGSLGWGKSYFTTTALLYILYQLSCLRDPQASLGLARDSSLSLINMSVTLELAKKVVFSNISSIINEVPYFVEKFPFQSTLSEIRFPKNICFTPVTSSDSGVLGLNVIAGAIDETNFLGYNPRGYARRKGMSFEVMSKAESIFNAIMRRMKTRYMQIGGALPGMLFVLSSERSPDDFTKKLIKDFRDDPGVFVRSYALWDTKPIFLKSKKFQVLVGNERIRSRIVDDSNMAEVNRLLKQEDGVYLIDVPEEFKGDFVRDIDGALRDIAGIATIAVHPLIPDYTKIAGMVDCTRVHPFSVYEWDMSVPGLFLWDMLVDLGSDRIYRPKKNPKAIRHAHIDLALNGDAAGICVGHVDGYVTVDRHNEVLPKIYIDFVLRIKAHRHGEILFSDIRTLLYKMIDHGFDIRYVTLDRYQSVDTIQQLRLKGIESEVLSVDTSAVPYLTLKDALYDGRVSCYEYQPLLKELRELEKDERTGKIDHPNKGSKDISDALAGVVYSLTVRHGEYRGMYYKPTLGKVVEDRCDVLRLKTNEVKVNNRVVKVEDIDVFNTDDWYDLTKTGYYR